MPSPILICVCLKPVWRTDVALRLDAAGHGVRPDEAVRVTNGADLAALQLALTLRSAHPGTQVLAVTVGPPTHDFVLREALAAGADAVLRAWGPGWAADSGRLDASGMETRDRARAVAEALRSREPALVLVGERSADTGAECFGGFLAQTMGADFAHRVTALHRQADGWQATVRLERGYGQDLTLAAPAVVTVPAQLPRPPYAALPAWIQARQAAVPVAEIAVAERGSAAPASGGETVLRVPVPRVKRYRVPDGHLPAEARIQALVSFPEAGAGSGTVLAEGTPQAQAQAVAALLRGRGYA